MPLTFRNLDTTPDDPVETWPLEGVITALERGGLSHRRRLAAAIKRIRGGLSLAPSLKP